MLNWTIKKTIQIKGQWLSIIHINYNGNIRRTALNWNDIKPTSQEISLRAEILAQQIQTEFKLDNNVLNHSDNIQDNYEEYLQCIITLIKNNNQITLQGIDNAIISSMPNNIFNFYKVMQRLKKRTKIVSFLDFKTFVINNTF